MSYIDINGGKVFYELLGNGTPILFIHPPGMGRKVFDYQKRLSDRFQIILPDFSGHGDSSPFTGDAGIINQYVDEINMILNKEQIYKAIICGYSAGGMVAQHFALTYPDRTKAVILSGGYPEVLTRTLQLEYILGMNVLKSSNEALAKVLAISHAKSKVYRENLYQHILKSNIRNWLQFYQETYHYSCLNALKDIKVPLLNVYGQYSPWINAHKKYYDVCPQADIAIVKNTSHQVPTKKWQAFNHVVRNFIEGHPR
ncbi:alpha/beta fold hydrolase [Aquibacillus salsiterrae]|uniref:Alpha/beta hydrolase n=1 Tax=Aquibacillus salsiterrae TaxID=2950439 RepID=A0A9X3WD98_9BACI|nr:alpha/beta hydrolase [Aquibacillus salsiterrae]MDC3415304.1 alpha/beta hydrolase [Aquibacillus salsiterrae]